MWKRTVLGYSAFISGYSILLTKHLPIVHSESSNHGKSSSRNEDFHSYIYLPENAEYGIYESSEPSVLSWITSKSPAYWNLLMLSKSKDKVIRHKAIDTLSKQSHLNKWQYTMIAQATDSRMSIGLARMPDVSLSFFLSSPLRNLNEGDLHSELYLLLMSLPMFDIDQRTENLKNRATASAKRVLLDKSNWDLEDSSSIFHSQQKKKAMFDFHKLSLLAILGYSAIKSHRNFLIEKGILQLLFKILKVHENDTEFQSLIAQILANIALEEKAVNHIFITGWISILVQWMKSPFLQVNLPAAKALANLDRDAFNYTQYDNGVYLLNPLFRESKKLSADVIFLHGLRGATFWTWRQNDSEKQDAHSSDFHQDGANVNYTYCWPKDWLAHDFPSIRILSLDYKTSVSNWRNNWPQDAKRDSLQNKAKDLIPKLLLSAVGERPIVWIAHSMGGLLVKHVLVEAAESNDYKLNLLLRNTVGIIFYSVPHKGSEMASFMNSASHIFQPSVDISQLKKNCPELLTLHEKFKDIILAHNIPVLSFGETKGSRWGIDLSILVPVDSSDPGFGEFYLLPDDHLSTCKPAARTSIIYSKVLDFLINLIPGQHEQVFHAYKLQDQIRRVLKKLTATP